MSFFRENLIGLKADRDKKEIADRYHERIEANCMRTFPLTPFEGPVLNLYLSTWRHKYVSLREILF